MDETTALSIGREWLSAVRASDVRLGALADTLQRIDAQPDTQALTADRRQLALLAGNELWIVTLDADTEDVTTVKVERVELSAERVRVSLTESHGVRDFDRPVISHTWLFEFEGGPELRFEAIKEPHRYGEKGDNPAVVFGWRLAEATGWTTPS
jgi:hypothetical protein